MSTATWLRGDVRAVLPTLPDHSVDLVTTSPPFWRQRGYLPPDHPDKPLEIGQEPHPGDFLDVLLELTTEFRRLLTPHGSIAIELGDTMAGSGGAGGDYDPDGLRAGQPKWAGSAAARPAGHRTGTGSRSDGTHRPPRLLADGILPKSHCMIPEAYRFALAWGINPFTGDPSPAGRWIIRNVVDWCRRNPTPGDDGDKFRRATSDIVIATLNPNRYWDGEPVREPASEKTNARTARGVDKIAGVDRTDKGETYRNKMGTVHTTGGTRPLYDWWDLASDPYPGAHYAVWPPEIARRLIVTMCPFKVCTTCGEPQRRIVHTTNSVGKAVGSQAWIGDTTGDLRTDMTNRNDGPDYAIRETVGWTDCGHDTFRPGHVLDPFGGTGTTGSVAVGNSRDATLIDLDHRNLELAYDRIGGLFLNAQE